MKMRRQDFLVGAGAVTLAALAPSNFANASTSHLLDIEESTLEIRPGIFQRTVTAGGGYPGTAIRAKLGSTIDVSVRNRTRAAIAIHWHGLIVSPEVDGVPALGTPPVEPNRMRTYRLPITVGGTRWYHAHDGADLLFGGLSGPLVVDRPDERGDYDQEVVLMLHEFKATFPSKGTLHDLRQPGAPTLTEPLTTGSSENQSTMSSNMAMHDAHYAAYAINGKALGFGEPIRVRRNQRVRFRIINASATLTHRIALPYHRFNVTELDGNPVPVPYVLEAIEVGPGERVDAIVTMDSPGIWALASTEKMMRENGLGIVIAYDGAQGKPMWIEASQTLFRYEMFGRKMHNAAVHKLDGTYNVVLQKSTATPGAWSINGKLFPHFQPLVVREDGLYLLKFQNLSMMEHPMHIHGHSFELVSVDGVSTSGIMKDTVVVRPGGGRVDVLLRATNPYGGRYLLHCHNDQHVEGGMATVLTYQPASLRG